MKHLFKGIGLGLSLYLVQKLCCVCMQSLTETAVIFSAAIVFFLITTAFLVSDTIPNLLLCGFCGLAVMFATEIGLLAYIFTDIVLDSHWLSIYVGGFFGSMAALVLAIILTLKHVRLFHLPERRIQFMPTEISKSLKIKLLIYAVLSACTFSYFIMPQYAGISVPIFTLVQLVCLWFLVPDRKRLWLFVPLFVLSLNAFISANPIWRTANLIISILLYACMFTDFSFKADALTMLSDCFVRLISPLKYVKLPFAWTLELSHGKTQIVKRVAIALAIALPCAVILLAVLASADMVFSMQTEGFFTALFANFKARTLVILICGVLAGLYLFGIAYCAQSETHIVEIGEVKKRKGDLLIINILLCVMLFVYTLFVIVQFKYLFAGGALPYGLDYTSYARKGFFELLALTGVNLAVILAVVHLTQLQTGKWVLFTKGLCHYLCAVTVVLLISSFYRMYLYTAADGLTRLRLYVLGFLIFEAIGLLLTFVYIAKPKLNIVLVYLSVALTYYCVLNIVPTDNLIAREQVDRYLSGERQSVGYVFTLSADAAPAIAHLHENASDGVVRERCIMFLQKKTNLPIPQRWQRWNLSMDYAEGVLDGMQ